MSSASCSESDDTFRLSVVKHTSNIGALLYTQNKLEEASQHFRLSIEMTLQPEMDGDESDETEMCEENKLLVDQYDLKILQVREQTERKEASLIDTSIAIEHMKVNHPKEFQQSIHDNLVLGMHFFSEPIIFGNSPNLSTPRTWFLDWDDFLPLALFFNMGLIRHRMNHLDPALQLYQSAYNNISQLFQDDEDFFANCNYAYTVMLIEVMIANNIGYIFFRQDKYDEASRYFTHALQISRLITQKIGNCSLRATCEDWANHFHHRFHDCLAATLLNLARTYIAIGALNQAMDLCKEVQSMRRVTSGDSHFDIVVAQFNIGLIHHAKSEFGHAAENYRIYLSQAKQKLGSFHPHVATALHSIGKILYYQNVYVEATEFFFQSAKASAAIFGMAHKDVADTLYMMGKSLQAQGNYKHAMLAYQRALTVQNRLFGTVHEDVLTSLCSIGKLHHMMNDLNESLKVMQQVVQVARGVHGGNHHFVADMLKTLGSIQMDMCLVDEAVSSFAEATRFSDI